MCPDTGGAEQIKPVFASSNTAAEQRRGNLNGKLYWALEWKEQTSVYDRSLIVNILLFVLKKFTHHSLPRFQCMFPLIPQVKCRCAQSETQGY